MDVQPHLLNLSAYINQNLEKDLPLSSLAKRVGLSPFHFHRKFGAYFGESLHQHIKRLRLERAAFALTHGNAPVRQIARESGYKTVSAFSHAFSGFAGESPTRYRSKALDGAASTDGDAGEREAVEPAWVGNLPPQDIAFVRTMGSGSVVQPAVDAAVKLMLSRIGIASKGDEAPSDGSADDERGNRGAQPDESIDLIAATSDVYGVSRTGEFRLDIGLDADQLPAERVGSLGRQTLPGGRYARFDFTCSADRVIEHCRTASLSGLQAKGETPRLSQYFVRFPIDATSEASVERDYKLFVPLLG